MCSLHSATALSFSNLVQLTTHTEYELCIFSGWELVKHGVGTSHPQDIQELPATLRLVGVWRRWWCRRCCRPMTAGWEADTEWLAASDGCILSYIHARRYQSSVSAVFCLSVDLRWWWHAAGSANELVRFSILHHYFATVLCSDVVQTPVREPTRWLVGHFPGESASQRDVPWC